MKNLQSPPLSSPVFKRVIDKAPVIWGLWKTGKRPNVWQEGVMIYSNEMSAEVVGAAFARSIGLTAGVVLAGFEETGFNKVFDHVFFTGEAQEFDFHFGNERIPLSNWHSYLAPLYKDYINSFSIDVTAQVRAEKAKAERIKLLEEINQKLIERELQMIQLKSEIVQLEQGA